MLEILLHPQLKTSAQLSIPPAIYAKSLVLQRGTIGVKKREVFSCCVPTDATSFISAARCCSKYVVCAPPLFVGREVDMLRSFFCVCFLLRLMKLGYVEFVRGDCGRVFWGLLCCFRESCLLIEGAGRGGRAGRGRLALAECTSLDFSLHAVRFWCCPFPCSQ